MILEVFLACLRGFPYSGVLISPAVCVKLNLRKGINKKAMETQQKGEEDQQATSTNDVGWSGMVVEQYQKIKENAETYPYVWASYIVVYGGFALWTTYRWRKLRKTEDRVRVLQERLRKLVEAEESSTSSASSSSSSSSSSVKNARPPIEKSSK